LSEYLAKIIATLFFVGYFPKASGTLGSFVVLVAAWFLLPQGTAINLIICVIVIIVSVWSSGKAEEIFGKDSKRIVIDETAGMLVSILMVDKSVNLYLAAFILFRFFDVVKPPPLKSLEKLKSGWGVTSDDLAAGVYANICLQALLYLKNILQT
jgi:phosphatidylglycerophosphatase A